MMPEKTGAMRGISRDEGKKRQDHEIKIRTRRDFFKTGLVILSAAFEFFSVLGQLPRHLKGDIMKERIRPFGRNMETASRELSGVRVFEAKKGRIVRNNGPDDVIKGDREIAAVLYISHP